MVNLKIAGTAKTTLVLGYAPHSQVNQHINGMEQQTGTVCI